MHGLPLCCQWCGAEFCISGACMPVQLMCGHVLCASDARMLTQQRSSASASASGGVGSWVGSSCGSGGGVCAGASASAVDSRVLECPLCRYTSTAEVYTDRHTEEEEEEEKEQVSFPPPHRGVLAYLQSRVGQWACDAIAAMVLEVVVVMLLCSVSIVRRVWVLCSAPSAMPLCVFRVIAVFMLRH